MPEKEDLVGDGDVVGVGVVDAVDFIILREDVIIMLEGEGEEEGGEGEGGMVVHQENKLLEETIGEGINKELIVPNFLCHFLVAVHSHNNCSIYIGTVHT